MSLKKERASLFAMLIKIVSLFVLRLNLIRFIPGQTKIKSIDRKEKIRLQCPETKRYVTMRKEEEPLPRMTSQEERTKSVVFSYTLLTLS